MGKAGSHPDADEGYPAYTEAQADGAVSHGHGDARPLRQSGG